MATVSSSTLLDAVNQVLTGVGERRVTSLSSPVAQLASNTIRDVVHELSTVHDWAWLRDRIPATAWNQQTATLTDIIRVWGVSSGSTTSGYYTATYVDKDVFDAQALTGYSDTAFPFGGPKWWTISSQETIQVNPYPTDINAQAKVLFDVTRLMVPPSVATGLFPMPEEYMSMIYYRAMAVMALKHLNDAESAAQFTALFETFAQRARERNGIHPAKNLTMHRRGRGRTYI